MEPSTISNHQPDTVNHLFNVKTRKRDISGLQGAMSAYGLSEEYISQLTRRGQSKWMKESFTCSGMGMDADMIKNAYKQN